MLRLASFLPLLPGGVLVLTIGACGSGGGGLDTPPTAQANRPADGGADDPSPETTFAILSVSPSAIDRDLGGTLELSGQGFTAPVRLEIVGETSATDGNIQALLSEGGTRATCPLPPMSGVGRSVPKEIRVRNGDGRELRIEIETTREYRSLDGRDNHAAQAERGSAGVALLRVLSPAYADGEQALAGADRPNPRAISNAVCQQTEDLPNTAGASGFLWQWGQFLDHDITLTPEAEPEEEADVPVPLGDPQFDPYATGEVVLPFHRSTYVSGSIPRQQTNEITAWIDASNVYGSDEARAAALRTLDGTGRLRTSAGDLLPFNTGGLPNAGGTDASLFLAGDVRANEQIGLTAMHVLFVREHNRLADELSVREPQLSGEEIYQEARRIVVAQMQVITYEQFLPLLLGAGALPSYDGYDASLDGGIANTFSTAAYRLGHSLLASTVLRLDADGNEIAEGHLSLKDAFFHPTLLVDEGGIEPLLRGLAEQEAQALDAFVVEDVRSFLFGPPGAGGLDLAALNLQRGRDHGLPAYNDLRASQGLPGATDFADVTSDPDLRLRLDLAYGEVDLVDPWVGCLAEDHVPGAMVGELLRRVLVDQFLRLRDGDRLFFERTFHGEELQSIRSTRLADVIRRNTTIGSELRSDVFRVEGGRPSTQPVTAAPLTEEREDRVRRWRGAPPRPR